MRIVVQNLRSGAVSVEDSPPPQLRPGGALVRTAASLISVGTERAMVQMGEKNLLQKARARPDLARQVIEKGRRDGIRQTWDAVRERLDTPGPLGYSAAGHVIDVGEGCPGVAVGDLVACSGAGYANHAEINYVPSNLLTPAPEGLGPEGASFGTVGAIALQGVRQAEVRLGETVVVIGLGLVGLLAVQLVAAAGGRAFGVDVDRGALARAEAAGAEGTAHVDDPVEEAVLAATGGLGADAVIVCASTSSDDPLALAGAVARDRAKVVLVGAVGTRFPRDPYYLKELDIRLSRSYGPGRYDPRYEEDGQDYPPGYVRWTEGRNIAEFLRLVAAGAVEVGSLITHRFAFEDATDAYALLSGDGSEEPVVGVLLEYPDADGPAGPSRVPSRVGARVPTAGEVGVGAIGAGSFARRTLFPALLAESSLEPVGVATASGLTAQRVASELGFRYSTSDPGEIIDDPDVGLVVIGTRHDSHAELAARALGAGKTTFCEKPLALDWAGLDHVAEALADRHAALVVGFNRRYSPLSTRLRDELPRGVPRTVICRVNAGPLPADHWTRDPREGGGRIVGELCHFLDLASFFAEGPPVRVSAEPAGGNPDAPVADAAVVNVAFSCGSAASLQYLDNGDPSLPKERVEVFCGGAVGVIDDFRSLELTRGGKRRSGRSRGQQKGHREELALVAAIARGDRPAAEATRSSLWSSALTLQTAAALRLGAAQRVELPRPLADHPDFASVSG